MYHCRIIWMDNIFVFLNSQNHPDRFCRHLQIVFQELKRLSQFYKIYWFFSFSFVKIHCFFPFLLLKNQNKRLPNGTELGILRNQLLMLRPSPKQSSLGQQPAFILNYIVIYVFLGLGVVLRERSFFHGNERNYQEQSHCSNKKGTNTQNNKTRY